ncbi:UNVERIFIED_ORG: AsnC family transcriptional regulator [Burkholderia sp. CF145]|nr:transcriptional regulator, AsnC family [Burkholderia sp. BT03]SKD06937.1 transcriptional regulator, AsnC family [Paraburkholderia hospita]
MILRDTINKVSKFGYIVQKYLSHHDPRREIMATQLDNFDRKLLMEVQRDAQIPQTELGVRVNLSTAAVNRRLRRLADEGVIDRYSAIVAPEKVDYPLTIVANVEVESEQIDLLDAMKRTFAQCPQIQQCYYVAGEWDFVLVMTVRNMDQYTELTRQLFFSNNNVKRFKTLVSMSRVKVGLGVPVDIVDE